MTTTDTSAAELRRAITDADMICQRDFSRIAGIAELTLLSLEAPSIYSRPRLLEQALRTIMDIAAAAENDVNVIAEWVGCNFVDEVERERQDARRAARAQRDNASGQGVA